MDWFLFAAGIFLTLCLVLVIRKRKSILAAVKSLKPVRRFAYDLTDEDRSIVKTLLDANEEEAAVSVVSDYFEGDIEPQEINAILDTIRRQLPRR